MPSVISGDSPPQSWYSALLTPLSLAINIVLGLAAIYGLWKKRSGRLEAHVTRHDFVMPFGSVAEFIKKDDSWKDVNPYSMDHVSSLWVVRISNLSKKKAVGVTVNMPNAVTVAQIEKNQIKRFVFPAGNQIGLDDLSPRDHVIVRTWLSSYGDIDKVLVSYDEGIARMKPQYLVGRWLYEFGLVMRYMVLPLLLGAVVAVAAAGLLAIAILNLQRAKHAATATPTPAQQTVP